MARSLNKATLIGNLTRDPELRYTPQGTAVCTFGVATNRQWKTDSGEDRDDAEFHRIVAWRQLAEICAKLLHKGDKVFVEGRIQTRDWTGQDGQKRTTTEIVINEMILLESKGGGSSSGGDDFSDIPEDLEEPMPEEKASKSKSNKKKHTDKKEDDDIPF